MAVNAEWLHFAQVIILSFSVHLGNLVSLDAQVQKRRVTTDCILTLIPEFFRLNFDKKYDIQNKYLGTVSNCCSFHLLSFPVLRCHLMSSDAK